MDSSANGGRPLDAVWLEPLIEVALPAGPGAAASARRIIAEHLTGRVSKTVVDDATLLATELVTNSVRHGDLGEAGSVTLRVSLGPGIVRLETEDSSLVGTVVVRAPDPGSGGGGFGLGLVDVLAARWGVSRAAGTKVWLELGRGLS